MTNNKYPTELIPKVAHPLAKDLSEEQFGIDLFNIGTVGTETLRRELAQSLTLTARHLAYIAAIWGELERRGEDLSALRSGLSIYLPQIAAGTLDAELVIKYAGQRMLLHAMSKLPIHTQKELAKTGEVPLAQVAENGEMLSSQVSLQRLSAADLRFVFAESKLRPLPDQYRMMANRKKPRAILGRQARKVIVENGEVKFGGRRTKLENVLEALSEHFGVDVKDLLEKANP